MSAKLPEWVLSSLSLVGLDDPNPDDALHVDLVNAVLDMGAGVSEGRMLTRLKVVVAQHFRRVSDAEARTRSDYEHAHARAVVRELARQRADGERVANNRAEQVATIETEDQFFRHRLAVSEKQALRVLLSAIESQFDAWRTEEATARAADVVHARGLSGGA